MLTEKQVKCFNKLVSFLKNNGFAVKVTSNPTYKLEKDEKEEDGFKLVKLPRKYNYRFALVTGKRIQAGFCEPNNGSYRVINGKIAADNIRCFDKWSKCPLVLEFPADSIQEKKLLELLKHLGSEEGYTLSNFYDYIGEGKNPYHY